MVLQRVFGLQVSECSLTCKVMRKWYCNKHHFISSAIRKQPLQNPGLHFSNHPVNSRKATQKTSTKAVVALTQWDFI